MNRGRMYLLYSPADPRLLHLQSVSLAVARGLSLFLGSVGGAFGAHAFPGYWGTLMGFNMGDTLAISISDGIVNE